MRLGMICRMDKSGLGAQTRRLARLLQPSHIMLINSKGFNNSEQHSEWYKDYEFSTPIYSFPNDAEVRSLLARVDVVISCETFYNNNFTRIAKEMGVKTILMANPEFFDWFKPEWQSVSLPDKVIVPSEWMMDKMERFGADYIPTPIFGDEFKEAREINLKRMEYKTRFSKWDKPVYRRKYLFMNGKTAVHDRNGLESLYAALELSKGDFTVTVKAQHDIKKHPDPRILYDFTNPIDQGELYRDFDALIQPRRYGGQTLSMCEALMCGLPVIMTDIDPNNRVLPSEWLVPATKTGEFMTRTMIDIYSADAGILAQKLDGYADRNIVNDYDIYNMKQRALSISKQFDAETLRPKYEELLCR